MNPSETAVGDIDKTYAAAEASGQQGTNQIRCLVYVTHEEDDGFAVMAAQLPGAASQGDTEAEALANITEALQGVVESYKECGKPVPWLETPRPKTEVSATQRWVIVHA